MSTTSFAVVITDIQTSAEVLKVATELVRVLARPVEVDGTMLRVGAIAGISFAPRHGCEAEALVKRAKTAACTAACQQTAALIWHPDSDLEAPRRAKQLGEVDRALANGELFLEYQSKIDLATGRLIGAEALVRWNHPQRGLISASEFIADIEQVALAIPFTAWTLRTALTTWLSYTTRLPGGSRVAVNPQRACLGNPDLLSLVQDALAATNAPPAMLELETIERGLVSSDNIVGENLEALRALGVDVVIDDFGTGHASLGYLRRLPVAAVKIDRIFIRHLDGDHVNRAIVTACVGVAAAVARVERSRTEG